MNNKNSCHAQQRLLTPLLLLLTLFIPFFERAKAEGTIPFSGIAFTSELSLARISLPYAFGSIGDLEASPSKFVQTLNAAANGLELENGNILSSTHMNDVRLGQSLVMALAIENERMKVEKKDPAEGLLK